MVIPGLVGASASGGKKVAAGVFYFSVALSLLYATLPSDYITAGRQTLLYLGGHGEVGGRGEVQCSNFV